MGNYRHQSTFRATPYWPFEELAVSPLAASFSFLFLELKAAACVQHIHLELGCMSLNSY